MWLRIVQVQSPLSSFNEFRFNFDVDSDGEAKVEKLTIRFKNIEIATSFKEAWMSVQEKTAELEADK